MKSNFLVSACIITYNQDQFIRECLEGAVNQIVNFDYEIIIGNDKSTDNTLKICEEYVKRFPKIIRLFDRKQNLGMIGNWTASINDCSGKYVAICEGDDYWIDPFKLQKQVDFLETNEDYAICFHSVNLLDNDTLKDDWITTVPKEISDINDLIENGNFIHTPSVIFRNANLDLPPSFSYSPIGDYFLYILLTQDGGKIKFIDEKMAVYRYGVGVHSSLDLNQINWNWHNTLFLLHSYVVVEYKNQLKQKLIEIKKYIEVYSVDFSNVNYLAQKLSFRTVIKILLRMVRKKFLEKIK